MRFVIAILVCLIILFGSYYYLVKYRSAFEADQACHSQQWISFADSDNYGCDHDLETKQWILFERGKEHQSAKVIQRFRY